MLSPEERGARIERYGRGAALLREALAQGARGGAQVEAGAREVVGARDRVPLRGQRGERLPAHPLRAGREGSRHRRLRPGRVDARVRLPLAAAGPRAAGAGRHARAHRGADPPAARRVLGPRRPAHGVGPLHRPRTGCAPTPSTSRSTPARSTARWPPGARSTAPEVEAAFERRRGAFTLSTDRSRLDLDVVHGTLARSYWAEGIPREVVARSIEGALCFGLYEGPRGSQVGFARVVTDRATYRLLGRRVRPREPPRAGPGRLDDGSGGGSTPTCGRCGAGAWSRATRTSCTGASASRRWPRRSGTWRRWTRTCTGRG